MPRPYSNLSARGTLYDNAVSQAQIALESAQANAAALADKLHNVEIANANAVGQAELTLENAKAHYWIAKKNLDDLDNALHEAECALDTAKATYESAKLNLDIVKALYDADPISICLGLSVGAASCRRCRNGGRECQIDFGQR